MIRPDGEPVTLPCIANLPKMIAQKTEGAPTETIARWSRKSGPSGRQVARDMEISHTTLQRVMSGKSPGLEVLTKICKWGGWSADELLGMKGRGE